MEDISSQTFMDSDIFFKTPLAINVFLLFSLLITMVFHTKVSNCINIIKITRAYLHTIILDNTPVYSI
jgi:hypothetical protein